MSFRTTILGKLLSLESNLKRRRALLKNKAGVIDQLQSLVIGTLVLSVVFGVSMVALSTFKANTTVAADGNATAGLTSLTTAINVIPNNAELLIFLLVFALIIGAVMIYKQFSK